MPHLVYIGIKVASDVYVIIENFQFICIMILKYCLPEQTHQDFIYSNDYMSTSLKTVQ